MLLILLLLSGVLHAQAFKWEPCDADKVPFVPDNVALVPDPPVIGSQVTFNIKGSNAVREVASGRITINVAYAGTPIYEEVDDLCSKTTCPITLGPIDVAYVQDLPPIAPPGEYQVQVVARDTEDAELMCVLVTFDMVPPSMAASRKLLKA